MCNNSALLDLGRFYLVGTSITINESMMGFHFLLFIWNRLWRSASMLVSALKKTKIWNRTHLVDSSWNTLYSVLAKCVLRLMRDHVNTNRVCWDLRTCFAPSSFFAEEGAHPFSLLTAHWSRPSVCKDHGHKNVCSSWTYVLFNACSPRAKNVNTILQRKTIWATYQYFYMVESDQKLWTIALNDKLPTLQRIVFPLAKYWTYVKAWHDVWALGRFRAHAHRLWNSQQKDSISALNHIQKTHYKCKVHEQSSTTVSEHSITLWCAWIWMLSGDHSENAKSLTVSTSMHQIGKIWKGHCEHCRKDIRGRQFGSVCHIPPHSDCKCGWWAKRVFYKLVSDKEGFVVDSTFLL